MSSGLVGEMLNIGMQLQRWRSPEKVNYCRPYFYNRREIQNPNQASLLCSGPQFMSFRAESFMTCIQCDDEFWWYQYEASGIADAPD